MITLHISKLYGQIYDSITLLQNTYKEEGDKVQLRITEKEIEEAFPEIIQSK